MTTFEKTRRDLMRMSMLTAIVGGASALALVLVPAKASDPSPEPGNTAPGFSGLASNGDSISLDQFDGKTVVLEWTNHGCPYVKKHYNGGNMQATQAVAAGDEDVVWISVISSAPGKQGHVSAVEANALTTSRGASPDYVILDETGTIGRAYNAKTTPQIVVIDNAQTVQYNGAMDDKPSANLSSLDGATNYALNALSAVTAGEAPDPARTKPYGCSVKYAS